MKISTQNCKDFIDSIGAVINCVNEKWKRTKKYNQDGFILRDFESDSGKTLTIADNNGQLFLYQFNSLTKKGLSVTSNTIYGKKVFTKQPTEKDILQFMVDCVKQDHSIVDDATTLKDALNIKSWTIWQKWTDKVKTNNGYHEETLEDFIEDDWNDFSLYFEDNNIQSGCLNPDDLKQVFWVGMPDYDTAYRIYIYQTKDNTLYLGQNDPD